MPLSFFKAWRQRPQRPAAPGPADASAVQAERTRARRRLIGALVLLAAGVAVFPLVFETEPRPMAGDTAMVVGRAASGQVEPAALPPPRPLPPVPLAPTPPLPQAAAASAGDAPAVLPVDAAASSVPPPRSAAPAASVAPAAALKTPPPARVAAKAAPAPGPAPGPMPASAPTAPRPTAAVAASAASEAPGRFVVQVGAYTEARALREARQRVERLGLKSYTQVVETAGGKRTRVRVGPFATRAEADAAATKLRGSGLPANILAL